MTLDSIPHIYAIGNRDLIKPDDTVGCYRCRQYFLGSAITKWVDRGQTALCPLCFLDCVLPMSLPEGVENNSSS